MATPNVLYISYDGLLEPLGQSQVLAYAKKLSTDFRMILLTFEKALDLAESDRVTLTRQEIAKYGIQWIPLRYHKRPKLLATGFDVAQGLTVALYLAIRYNVKIVHCRSYVAALMGLCVKMVLRIRFIFDMRGFWVDECVEKGMWRKNSKLYRLGKFLEKRYLRNADAIVSLTQAAVDQMSEWDCLRHQDVDFRVITTCCDLDRFSPGTVGSAVPRGNFVLGYVGNIGIWYRFDSVLECFKYLLEIVPEARLLVINRDQQPAVWEAVDSAGINREMVEVNAAFHQNMAGEIRRMNATVFFIKPSFAKLASAPTKLGELLGCGVPCLTSRGVGDMDAQISESNVGVLIDFDQLNCPEILRGAIGKLLKLSRDTGTSARCNASARKYFSLDQGAERYRRLYIDLMKTR